MQVKITKERLQQIIVEEILREEKKEDKDLDIAELEGLNLPAVLKKLLDPDIPPAKYATIDQMVDASGNINHQAFAIAAFVLSYADMDEGTSKKILSKAVGLIPKILKAKEKGAEKPSSEAPAS